MNYFEYTSTVPMGRWGLMSKFKSFFTKDDKQPSNEWNQSNGSVTINGKTYHTNNSKEVVALQQELLRKGYNIGSTNADGKFGKNTQAAVTKYLQSNGAGQSTTSDSKEESGSRSFNIRSWFQRDPEDSWDQNTGTVTIGGKTYQTSNKQDVVSLQKYLTGKGYSIGSADGILGKRTQTALNSYLSQQQSNKSNSKETKTTDATPWHMKFVQAVNAGGNYITGNPGVHAVATAIPGMYHKYIVNPIADFVSQNVNETLGEGMRRTLSINPGTRTNRDITPVEQKIYNSLGNYVIRNNRTGLNTGDINRWYRTEGYQLMKDLGYELPEDWRYSKNDLGWKTKLFNPLEKIMNVNGRMSLERDDKGNYYFTDVYDHNQSSYISDKHIDNSASQDQKSYLGVVKWLQNNAHPSDADPDYQKHSTRIQIYH